MHNTEFDIPVYVKIEKDKEEMLTTLAPCELKHIKI